MAFFDKFTSKTKELTESAKLSLKLAEEKRKLPELYERLGQFVFTRYQMGEPTDEAYYQIINAILSVKDNIRSIGDEIESIRTYVERKSVCPMCGAVNTNTDVCMICGSDIPTGTEECACEADDSSCECCGEESADDK